MKKAFFYLLAAGAMMFAATSCEKPNENPNGNGTDPKPSEFDASKFECLQGSDYYLLAMDEKAEAAIHGKVKADLRVDNTNTFLYVWENTYNAGTPTGPNFFGLVEGWPCLVVGSLGWSGLGLCSFNKTALDLIPEITENPEDYTFHIALKSQDNAIHTLVMYSCPAGEATVLIDVPGGKNKYSFERDGEWHEIEIPMTDFTNQGLIWNKNKWVAADPATQANGFNVLAILSGAFGEVNLDACFIYKKAAK